MGKKSKPKAPDAKGAAEEEGRWAARTAREATYADRPDQYNPFGSVTWEQEAVTDPGSAGLTADGASYGYGGAGNKYLSSKVSPQQMKEMNALGMTGNKGEQVTKWTQKHQLNRPTQQLFDSAMGGANKRGMMANDALSRSEQELGQPLDWEQFGQGQELQYDPTELRQRAEDQAYQKQTSRLDPRFQKRAQDLEIELRNKGLRPGDQAYDAQMSTFGNERTDAYEQARLGAGQIGMQEAGQLFGQETQRTQMSNALRDQQIQEYLAKRGQSLGEYEKLSQGQQLGDVAGLISGSGSGGGGG